MARTHTRCEGVFTASKIRGMVLQCRSMRVANCSLRGGHSSRSADDVYPTVGVPHHSERQFVFLHCLNTKIGANHGHAPRVRVHPIPDGRQDKAGEKAHRPLLRKHVGSELSRGEKCTKSCRLGGVLQLWRAWLSRRLRDRQPSAGERRPANLVKSSVHSSQYSINPNNIGSEIRFVRPRNDVFLLRASGVSPT